MNTSIKAETLMVALATHVTTTDDELVVTLADGRTVSAPIIWFPRLAAATPAQRKRWRLVGDGEGINWPELDEDLSVEGLLAGGSARIRKDETKRSTGTKRSR